MLRCYHDLPSAASAVAVLRLQRLADEGLAVEFEGFETHPAASPLPVTLDVLAERERWQDRAAALGLELARPANVPPTALVHAIEDVARDAGLGASWRETTYRAYWEEGADVSDHGVLAALAQRAGLEQQEVAAVLDDPAASARIRQRSGRRRSSGVGGVPMLEVSGALVPADLTDEELRTLASR
ncbi:MAG: DsbA family protein [Nitriliruptorales bacterium]|nr:DsbA family protein [Nitriliruptorales bacterium]